MAEVKWIKVSTDMFSSNRKIKQIEVMPEGDTILVIWLKLLLLAGNINDGGDIYLTPEIPYTDEMLAEELRRPLTTVRLALATFERFGMIEIIDDVLHLSSWEKYQNVDKLSELREYNRIAQQKSRQKRKSLAVIDMSMTCQPCQDTEEDKDLNKEKEPQSFILSNPESQRTYLQGIGKGVVLLSEEQMSDLLDKLSVNEFDHYVGVIADNELNGKHYKKKTHYQAILDMAAKDRKVKT